MGEDKNEFSRILRKLGYDFPKTEEQVDRFEQQNKKKYVKPSEWSDIEEVLNNKLKKKKFTQVINLDKRDVNSLAMAAREGKKISEEVRKRMEKDKKNAKK